MSNRKGEVTTSYNEGEMIGKGPTQRFSDRVENYAKYRPGYPAGVYALLQREAGLQQGAAIADLGSGTGLLSKLFLERGHRVFGVEPNAEMRQAAERLFAGNANFASVAGAAEATTLEEASVDFVAAGQAFHWFEPAAAKAEMRRIMRPGGSVALIWNQRDLGSMAFMQGYERLLEGYGTDFAHVDQQRTVTDEKLANFFAPFSMKKLTLPNQQTFDLKGLRGRLLSSSYTPTPGHASYEPMLAALEALYKLHQLDGKVTFVYLTAIYMGRVS